jgi:hypothetical protein
MNGESSDNKAAERMTESALEYFKYMVDALNRLFGILFSYEELTVRDLHISVRREQTLRSFMPLTGEQPPMPREIIAVEVSARLGLQEPLDLDLLANIAKDMNDAGLKASCHAGEIQVKISLSNIPLA